jgi:hypothetical protein
MLLILLSLDEQLIPYEINLAFGYTLSGDLMRNEIGN